MQSNSQQADTKQVDMKHCLLSSSPLFFTEPKATLHSHLKFILKHILSDYLNHIHMWKELSM
jgi:hypothetical protein